MRVSVETGCRLHLGFTNLSEDIGRCFGSIGVAIDRPGTSVVFEEHDELAIAGEDREPVRAAVRRFCDAYGVEPRVSITVKEHIPEHVGLGSGTQLALAVGAGLAAVCGIDTDVREIAFALQRGRRSGIGIAAFRSGGFVIDAGSRGSSGERGAVPTVVWRHDFPADWCFVIAVPAGGEGLSSHGEEGVFASLTPSVHISEEVCRITQLLLMPALVERDIESFGRAITAIDRKTGAYFSDVQGGVYSHEATNETVAAMLREGAFGAGQSSWGPAVYGLVRESQAARLASRMREYLQGNGLGDSVTIAHGRNTRAKVEVRSDAL
jgi:beta-ribofuranosylaminobenzene 5'-phosphate synthase